MLSIRGISVRFGDFEALGDVSLDLPAGATTAILGPSGSGKTTLLRVVAGLQAPDSGTVVWHGTDVTAFPPHRRNFGLMFQDFALFPHRDVWGNVAFGLHMRGDSPTAVAATVTGALQRVGLSGFEQRSVTSLSGGEAQRVALARALAPEPDLLMFDEPLGSLDRELRDRLVEDLHALLDGLDITAVYVTHDRHEALAIGDHLVVMRAGRVVQDGPPAAVWDHPADPFVARFLGIGEVLEVHVEEGHVRLPWGPIGVPGTAPGTRSALLRSDALAVDDNGPLTGEVTAVRFSGHTYRASVAAPDGSVLRVETARPLQSGEEIRLNIGPGGLHFFD